MLNNTEHTGYAVKLAVSRIRRRYDDHTSLGLSSFLSSCVLRADIHSCDSSDASQLSRSHLSILRPSILLYKIGFIIHLWNCRHFCCESSRYPISRLYMLSSYSDDLYDG
ncbi:putative ATP synthase F1, delta subunit [Trichinella spiralis]|uniref:putative ATP synthase F1, delta subunit n=1 Tax=Trichinella spiralis TaxID=6334 RepID=UPI0001EFD4C0|nr:putative ATP synthase F1, delta subunit [Trichinella spiralis]